MALATVIIEAAQSGLLDKVAQKTQALKARPITYAHYRKDPVSGWSLDALNPLSVQLKPLLLL